MARKPKNPKRKNPTAYVRRQRPELTPSDEEVLRRARFESTKARGHRDRSAAARQELDALKEARGRRR